MTDEANKITRLDKESRGGDDHVMMLAVLVPADAWADVIEFIHDTPAPRKVTNKLMKQLEGLLPQQVPIKKGTE